MNNNQKSVLQNFDIDEDENGDNSHYQQMNENVGTNQFQRQSLLDRWERQFSTRIAYYYMILSSLFMALTSLCTKYLSAWPSFQILFLRSLIILIGLFLYIRFFTNQSAFTPAQNIRKFILLQSCFGFLTALCHIYGIKKLPLSEAICIMNTAPILTGLVGLILLRKKTTKMNISSVVLAIVGFLLMIRPQFIFQDENLTSDDRISGGIVCLLQAFLFAWASQIIKFTGQNANPMSLVFYVVLTSCVLSALPIIFSGLEEINFKNFIITLLMSLCYFGAQFFLTKSLQLSKTPEIVQIINFLQVAFSLLFDYAILQEFPTELSLAGGLIILISTSISVFKLK